MAMGPPLLCDYRNTRLLYQGFTFLETLIDISCSSVCLYCALFKWYGSKQVTLWPVDSNRSSLWCRDVY